MSNAVEISQVQARLERDNNIWLATTRPDGRPHVAPLWFIWHENRAYLMTGGIKLENIRHNPFVAIHTEDGNDVVIIEGTARIVPPQSALFGTISQFFMNAYEWNIHRDIGDQQLIEVTPVKTLAWNANP